MSAQAFLTNVAILSTIMAVAAVIEAAVPMFTRTSWAPGRRGSNLGLTAVVFLLNWSLSSATAILIHHSRDLSETNSNYGNVLTIYDRMLGTFTSSDRAERVVYGLDDADPARIASFGGLLSMPFQQEAPHSLTEKSGSGRAYTDNIPA